MSGRDTDRFFRDMGIDEDYGDGPPPQEIYVSPIRVQPSTPPQPQGRRVARFRQANSESSGSDDDMFSGLLSLQQLSQYGSDVGPNALARGLAQSGLRDVLAHQLPNVPIRPMALNAIARPSRVSQRPRVQNAEAQWTRLTEREKSVIRRMLREIPCNVSHQSELGMMQLVNRFRNSRRRNGGGKKSHKKTHRRK